MCFPNANFIWYSGPFGKVISIEQQYRYIYWAIAIDMYYLNHAINYILYLISGREFRKHLCQLFCKSHILTCCEVQRVEVPMQKIVVSDI